MRLAAAYLICAVTLAAETVVSEEEAVARALSGSPEVLALREGLAAARARGSRLAAFANPELRVGISGFAAAMDGEDDRRTNVGLRWSPPSPRKVAAEVSAAVLRVSEAEGEVRAEENRMAAEVRLLHRTVRLLDEQIRIARESVEAHSQLAAVVREQVEARVKTVLELARCDAELASAKAAEGRLAVERRLHLARFCHKTGIACSELLTLAGGPDLAAPVDARPDVAELRRQALATRPEITSAATQIRLADLAVAEARRERLPWISFVQVSRLSPGSRWGLNVGVDTGLLGWRSGVVRVAEADAARARLSERAVRRAVTAEVDELLLRLDSVRQRLAGSDGAIASLSRQLELLTVQLGSGECDRTEPLAAKIRLLDAHGDRVSLLIEFWALEAGLRQAIGQARA